MTTNISKSLLSMLLFNANSRSPGETKSPWPFVLTKSEDLSMFSFWTRGTIREFLIFASREVAGRTNKGERTCIRHSPKDLEIEFHTHCYVTAEGLGCVVITGGDYNQRVAFSLVIKAIEAAKKDKGDSLLKFNTDVLLTIEPVDTLFKKFLVPEEADIITKIEKDVSETREVLIQNIDKLLQRGEKLEELMERSQDLSFQSKAFAKQAKSLNSCCNIL